MRRVKTPGLFRRVRTEIALYVLPTEFDMVMLCDVGSFSEILFRRIYDVLNLQGHLVIVDKFAPSRSSAPPLRLSSAFLHSLEYPSQTIDLTTTEMVQTRLQQAGFRDFSITSVPHKDNLPWNRLDYAGSSKANEYGLT